MFVSDVYLETQSNRELTSLLRKQGSGDQLSIYFSSLTSLAGFWYDESGSSLVILQTYINSILNTLLDIGLPLARDSVVYPHVVCLHCFHIFKRH